ncbi:hypothetical protein CDD82_6256 [Ophiocordyceps australis]|uniref:Xylulose kinase n=1 Tax=Ophiocordyceps australis TaxID=1399860 RepID=A0A2C5ZSE8_9HYPO|nr:hypothetical protein CDD82_6256 [Ophiocordyceps australis]
MADQGPLYLGFDLSTQQLKAIVVGSDLATAAQAKVDFDADLGAKYGIHKGVHANAETGEVTAPVAMWLEAVDLVLSRLASTSSQADGRALMHRIRAIGGSGQQHGSIFWNDTAAQRLAGLDASTPLAEQLSPALALASSPNWQDQSTQRECDAFDAALGGRQCLAHTTGSGAHHRFTGPQIMRLRRTRPDVYARTARISLVSSWLASVLLGKLAPLDLADVCGMNLWDVPQQQYSKPLLRLAAGDSDAQQENLRKLLGEPVLDAAAALGPVAPYFVSRYGFSPDCQVMPFTGDNPATILALPLRPLDAIVSLGTSTTFLMNTPKYRPHGSYHFFNHPTTKGHYMFMLCYKNGGLAREKVRDALPPPAPGGTGWETFDQAVFDTPPLDLPPLELPSTCSNDHANSRAKLGLYFPLRETVPNIRPGTWRFTCRPNGDDLGPAPSPWPPSTDARVIVESQALSMRLRSQNLVHPPAADLPAQPRRIYLVGGAARNPAIASVLGSVLGGADGVYKLDVGENACALGGAFKALWASERAQDQTFDDFVAERWKEEGSVQKVNQGFHPQTYARYQGVLGAFAAMEQRLLAEEKHSTQ